MAVVDSLPDRAERFSKEFIALYRETGLGYLLVLPAVIMVSILVLYPTAVGVYTAFFERSLLYPEQAQWIGLGNFERMLSDSVFRGSFLRSVLLTALAVSLQYLFGLALAIVLKQKVPGIGIFRSFSMVPWVLPTVVMVTIFNFMLQPQFGLVNVVLSELGLPDRYWFGDPDMAFPLVVFLHVWRNAPFFGIALMAGMISIPDELYEAAQMDGAGPLQQFRYITLPNISEVSMIMIILHVIYTFNEFSIVYLSTGGGPLNNTEVIATYVYKTAFIKSALGYGAAMGTVMLIVLLVFTALYIRVEEIE